MSHGNEMICQSVTLSGYAEWPKVADAVIEAAGGIEKKNERMLGDVLIPEVFVEYDHGKATPEGFERRYQPYRASRTLLDLAHETEKLGWCNQIQSKRPDGTHKRINPLAHFGVLMSGQQVVTE